MGIPSFLCFQILELQRNRIGSVTRANFYGISASKTIDTLNLSDNLIQEIPANCFIDLHSLNSLDLEGNLIHFIHSLAFAGISGKQTFGYDVNEREQQIFVTICFTFCLYTILIPFFPTSSVSLSVSFLLQTLVSSIVHLLSSFCSVP